jgi:hypothetical protein
LARCDNLEQISIDGNAFIEDEKYIRKYIMMNLKQVVRLNGEFLKKTSEYNIVSSPSQATTGGACGISTSLFPDLMRELSNFSSGLKQSTGIGVMGLNNLQKQDPSLFGKKSESLINAKAGKNRSRRASNEDVKNHVQQQLNE